MTSQAEQEAHEKLDTPIGGVPAEYLLAIWPKVAPILRRVVKPISGYTLDHVLTELQQCKMQLWVVDDFKGVVITSIQTRPTQKVLWVQFLAGDDFDSWMEDWRIVQEAYARHNGCAAIEFSGRPGWNKFKHHHPEYKQTYVTFRKELDDGQ